MINKKTNENPAEWISTKIVEFTNSAENTLMNAENEPAWDKPIVGFANGNDPLWDELKKDIGSFYWTPFEIFAISFPSVKTTTAELTVISWILPQTEKTKSDHRKEEAYPSERWSRSRKYGEDFNVKLRIYLAETLNKAGYEAVAPLQSPRWKRLTSQKYGISSTWSERHAAYAAGLGTFGLCDGLITTAGKAMRCGSVIARLRVPVSPRTYQAHLAYCRTCGKCIDRCPVGAITEKGHDKQRCEEFLHTKCRDYTNKQFGFDAYSCGLCQVGVPCESGMPGTD